jgi:gamma-glutamyltranspeptidase/glutathione hydrolase
LRHVRHLIAALAVGGALAAPVAAGAQTPAPPKQPTATGTGGAAATVDPLATRAAIDVLRRGGNAVDAAVAAAGVLGVTEPFSCGIGGGGFMVIRTASGKVTTIDSRETAPARMRPTSFLVNGRTPSFPDARYSGLSAGVPGTLRAWQKALSKYGTISLRRALQPGIRVARDGFVVDQTFASQIGENTDYFNDVPSTAALYLDPDGTPLDPGTTFKNPDLARTYRRIARQGPAFFYRGRLSRAIVAAVRRPPVAKDANHRFRPGVMRLADLRRYRAVERRPAVIGYRGLQVVGMGPPSSGGSTVEEALNILEGYPLSGAERTRALHLYLEASRLAYADRNVFLADPDFFAVPLRGLLSDDFAAQRRRLLDPARAGTSPVPPGDPYAFDTVPAAPPASVSLTREGPSTTNLTVADRRGNVVEYTFTIESTGGNAIVVPGYGFLLNNELTDFNYNSTVHPNRVEGGKRPRSSIAPTIVLRDNRPVLAVGSPGGATIITTVLQILVDRLDLGATLPQAIAAPRASQRNAAKTEAEPAFIASPEGQALAAQYGHAFNSVAEIGAATGIEFLGNGRFLAAAEPTRRGGGSAMVVRPGS